MRSIDKTNSRTFGRRAFTLAELLIVVAIIAVLVGISIPIFTSQFEKSREATDIANMRAAKVVAVQLYYEGVTDQATAAKYGLQYWGGNASSVANIWGVYDPETGYFVSRHQTCTKEFRPTDYAIPSKVRGSLQGIASPEEVFL